MTFGEACTKYLSDVQHALKPGSFNTEMSCINRLLEVYGKDVNASEFDNDSVSSYRRIRSDAKIANSTINQEVAVWSKVMRHCKLNDPAKGMRKLKVPKPMRQLLTDEQVEAFCQNASIENSIVGAFIRFLAYSGAREREGLAFLSTDFDREKRTLCIGSDGNAKNGRHRFIQCSDALYVHLCAVVDSDSRVSSKPFRLLTNSTHRYVLERVRDRLDMDWVGFHDFRHYFASKCVMSGIDFHTIAEWLGHSDSSLLAKRYAHLSDSHRKQQAQRLKFQ